MDGGIRPESEEGKKIKMKKSPTSPSKREREIHSRTHLPFREWCEHCVKSKGRNRQRRREAERMEKEEDAEEATTTISIDYAYFNDSMQRMSKREYETEMEGGNKVNKPMIVMEDRLVGTITAHMCMKKGPEDKWIASRIAKDIEYCGYKGSRVVLKCDQEAALVAVQGEVAKMREGVPTIPRHSPVGESQSNGRVECAIQFGI